MFKKSKRTNVTAQPFPAKWLRVIETNIPLFKRLPPALQRDLQDHIKIFVSEKRFEGCGGLQINDEIRITVAAQACILLLNRETDYYPDVVTILVYPTAFIGKYQSVDNTGIVTEVSDAHLGEAWQIGVVILAWDKVLHGAVDLHDGKNLVFHEFAHQLDIEDGIYDGTPLHENRTQYLSWVRVMGESFKQLNNKIESGQPTFLDEYGATDPAEFFAVATEFFFEKPKQMLNKLPQLYEQLKDFYKQDPVNYV